MKDINWNDTEDTNEVFDGKDRSKRKERRERKEKDKDKRKKKKCRGDCDNCVEPCEDYYLR